MIKNKASVDRCKIIGRPQINLDTAKYHPIMRDSELRERHGFRFWPGATDWTIDSETAAFVWVMERRRPDRVTVDLRYREALAAAEQTQLMGAKQRKKLKTSVELEVLAETSSKLTAVPVLIRRGTVYICSTNQNNISYIKEKLQRCEIETELANPLIRDASGDIDLDIDSLEAGDGLVRYMDERATAVISGSCKLITDDESASLSGECHRTTDQLIGAGMRIQRAKLTTTEGDVTFYTDAYRIGGIALPQAQVGEHWTETVCRQVDAIESAFAVFDDAAVQRAKELQASKDAQEHQSVHKPHGERATTHHRAARGVCKLGVRPSGAGTAPTSRGTPRSNV